MLSFLLALLQVTRFFPILIAAFVGFMVGPRLKLKRVTGACLAALLWILIDDLYFVQAGGSVWRWAVIAPVILLWLAPWYLIRMRTPIPSPASEPFDPSRHRIPDPAAAWLRMTMEELSAEGFVVIGDLVFRLTGSTPRFVVMDHPGLGARAVMKAGVVTPLVTENSLGFDTVLPDGRRLAVGNGRQPRVEPAMRDSVTAQLPHVRNTRALLAAFRGFVRMHAGEEPCALPPGEDGEAYFAANAREYKAEMLARGWYRRGPDESVRTSLRADVTTRLRMLFPLRQLRLRAVRRREERLLREMGLPVPPLPADERSPAWWLSFGGLQATGAMALLLLGLAWPWMAARGGYAALMPLVATAKPDSVKPERLPGDFTVPADFPGAVAALERLAGSSAKPFTADDGYRGERTDGMVVMVPQSRVKGLLAAAQPAFRERGFFLFESNEFRHFNGEAHELALFPVSDPFAVLLTLNTNGGNYGIEPKEVVAWLRGIDQRHPLMLTGAGFDYVQASFRDPLTPAEARALAAEVARFCPDVVTQGTGSVRELAAEMRNERILYCWWD